jgi:hypothetical protein
VSGTGADRLFGYGSLVAPASAAATLGRPVGEPVEAELRGWRRGFSLLRDNRRCEKTFARASDGWIPDFVLALNVEKGGADDTVNGALIDLAEGDLERLDRREIRYRRVDVTEAVTAAGAPAPGRVLTYVARDENLARDVPPSAVILRSYVDAVEEAFEGLGSGALERYRRTTSIPDVERIDARLVHDAIPPGNPRGW